MIQIAFEHPAYLALLLLLPLVIWVTWQHSGRIRRGRQAFALGTRLFLLTCLILALAGLQGVRQRDDLTVVFLLDRSESIPAEDREAAEGWVQQALDTMPPGDRAAVVAFGQDILVERSPSPDRNLDPVTSIPLPNGSDIAGAIRLGMALLPGDTAGRLILLSDGLETTGDSREAARLAAARGIAVDVVAVGHPPAGGEVLLTELAAPTAARQGQTLELAVQVESTVATEAFLQVISGGALLEQRPVALSPGTNRFLFSLQATERGFQRHEVYIRPVQDTWTQNNQASAFTNILGPPHLLLVEGAAGEAVELALALRAADLPVDIVPPGRLPPTAQALAAYDALFLIDAPASDLPIGSLSLLQSYVRDLGHGLVMVGGPASFGRGGYLRTPIEDLLPVDLRPRDRTQRPELALVLVLDRSGSMSSGGTEGGGPSKLQLAVEASVQAAQALEEGDLLGVVAFDTTARWVVPLEAVDPDSVASALAGLDPGGGTSIFAGLRAARDAILESDTRLCHVILLSDGWSDGQGYGTLVEELYEGGATTSIIAIGEDPADYLQALAEQGGGRYFWVRRPEEIPQVLLDETLIAMGAYIVEEPFQPVFGDASPILANLQGAELPLLYGYNGTWPKDAAQMPLYTHRGEPLLAHWNYGLGRSVAWTSDLKGGWAADWVSWDEFPSFAAQLTGWVLPLPEEGKLEVETNLAGQQLHLTVASRDEQGRPQDFLSGQAHLVGPNLEVLTTTLFQVGPGRYRAEANLPATGAYLMQIQLVAPDGQVYRRQSGVVVPYSPEYRALAPDTDLMGELTYLGGGSLLTDPAPAFAHTLPPARVVRDWRTGLLLVAALLLPVDVAARRLRLSWGEIRPFLGQLRERLPRRRQPALEEPTLPDPLLRTVLRARRERRARWQEQRPRGQPTPGATPEVPSPTPLQEEAAPLQESPAPSETLSRLRQAKDRARRQRQGDREEE
jgi:Mg-chelatase subunit ChlD